MTVGVERPGVLSVVLPTRRWSATAATIAGQLGSDDELVVACDAPSDPVVDRLPADDGVRHVIAGEPIGCSGKCNALAAGIEAATGDVLVLVDDDFDPGSGWLELVRELTAAHDVVSGLPLFRSERPFGLALEPAGVLASGLLYASRRAVWGGTVAVRRDALDVDAYVRDLRRTVSDDALLSRRIPTPHVSRTLVREVTVPGTLRDTTDRTVRWLRSGRFFDPLLFSVWLVATIATTLGLAVATLPVTLATVVLTGAVYAWFGHRRWTFLLAPVGLPAILAFALYAQVQPEFRWGERRYRWRDPYDVEVLD